MTEPVGVAVTEPVGVGVQVDVAVPVGVGVCAVPVGVGVKVGVKVGVAGPQPPVCELIVCPGVIQRKPKSTLLRLVSRPSMMRETPNASSCTVIGRHHARIFGIGRAGVAANTARHQQ